MATAAIAQATERASGRAFVAGIMYQIDVNALLLASGRTVRPLLSAEQMRALDFAYQHGIKPAQFVEQLLACEAAQGAAAVAS
jgi:hypothetical protein